jgi:hypothetical protein
MVWAGVNTVLVVESLPAPVDTARLGVVQHAPGLVLPVRCPEAVGVDQHRRLVVGGVQPFSTDDHGSAELVNVGLVRAGADADADPNVWLRRDRWVRADVVDEELSLVSYLPSDATTEVAVEVAADLASIGEIKSGERPDRCAWCRRPRGSAGRATGSRSS